MQDPNWQALRNTATVIPSTRQTVLPGATVILITLKTAAGGGAVKFYSTTETFSLAFLRVEISTESVKGQEVVHSTLSGTSEATSDIAGPIFFMTLEEPIPYTSTSSPSKTMPANIGTAPTRGCSSSSHTKQVALEVALSIALAGIAVVFGILWLNHRRPKKQGIPNYNAQPLYGVDQSGGIDESPGTTFEKRQKQKGILEQAARQSRITIPEQGVELGRNPEALEDRAELVEPTAELPERSRSLPQSKAALNVKST